MRAETPVQGRPVDGNSQIFTCFARFSYTLQNVCECVKRLKPVRKRAETPGNARKRTWKRRGNAAEPPRNSGGNAARSVRNPSGIWLEAFRQTLNKLPKSCEYLTSILNKSIRDSVGLHRKRPGAIGQPRLQHLAGRHGLSS